MKARFALLGLVAALASACAGNPTWDASVFPQQMSYEAPGSAAPVASVAGTPSK